MNYLTVFGACAVTIMLYTSALAQRSAWWVLIFALACAASSLYGWFAGTWPFGVAYGSVGIGRSASMVVEMAQSDRQQSDTALTDSLTIRNRHQLPDRSLVWLHKSV